MGCVLLFVTVLLLFSSFAPIAESSGMSVVPDALMENVLARLADLSGSTSTADFSLRSLRQLKNTQGHEAYTLLELNPYGYAVILNGSGMLLEACLTEDSVLPFTERDKTEYSYVGPSQFAYETNLGLVLVRSNTLLSEEAIQSVRLFEESAQAAAGSAAASDGLSVSAASPSLQSYIKTVGGSYFPSLNNLGNNRYGTCTVIAAAMLLGYYDANVHPAYVDAAYTVAASPASSAGTTEAFHQLLCNYVYGHAVTGGSNGITIGNALSGFNSYPADRSLPISLCFADDTLYSANGFYNVIADRIEDGHPVIAGFSQVNSDGSRPDHSVDIYGYSYIISDGGAELNSEGNSSSDIDYSTLMFKTHFGWLNSTQANRERWVSAVWFHQCAYIPDCGTNGAHYSAAKKYITGDYHSGNYHYYRRQLACCSCGVNTGTDREALPCDGNCVSMMINREVS